MSLTRKQSWLWGKLQQHRVWHRPVCFLHMLRRIARVQWMRLWRKSQDEAFGWFVACVQSCFDTSQKQEHTLLGMLRINLSLQIKGFEMWQENLPWQSAWMGSKQRSYPSSLPLNILFKMDPAIETESNSQTLSILLPWGTSCLTNSYNWRCWKRALYSAVNCRSSRLMSLI